jgi:hypothetical protein
MSPRFVAVGVALSTAFLTGGCATVPPAAVFKDDYRARSGAHRCVQVSRFEPRLG